MKKWLIASGCAVLSAAISATVFLSGPATTSQTAVALTALRMPQRHSNKDFEELQLNISYDEASRTLGHIGHFGTKEIAAILPDNIPPGSQILSWPNPDGSRIVLIFKNDRLIQKLRYGMLQ